MDRYGHLMQRVDDKMLIALEELQVQPILHRHGTPMSDCVSSILRR